MVTELVEASLWVRTTNLIIFEMPKYITEEYLKQKFIKTEVIEHENNVINSIQKPVISVITIAYQHAEYIEDCINGVLMQNLNCEWEYLIADDESTDGTREICIRYAKKYPDRIRLFLHSQENQRKVLNKPSGIFPITYNTLKTRGKYVAGCSGDDVWTDPLKLQKQLELMTSDNEISLCYQSWYKVLHNEDGSVINDKVDTSYHLASTTLFKNINNILPIQLLNVIQEDEFMSFILRRIGKFRLTENLTPVVKNSLPDSVLRTLNLETKRLHVANLHENIFVAYYNTKYFIPAFKQILIFYVLLLIKSNYITIFQDLKFVTKSFYKIIHQIISK
jgi:glycosyltransferase involved in cell wall biosynthesis